MSSGAMDIQKPFLSRYRFPENQRVLFETHVQSPTPEPVFGMHLPPEIGVVLEGCAARYSGGICHKLPRGGLWISGMLEPHGYQGVNFSVRTAVFILRPDFLFGIRVPGVDNHVWRAPFNTLPKDRPALVDGRFAALAEDLISSLKAGGSRALQSARIQLTLLNFLLLANTLGTYKAGRDERLASVERVRPAIEFIHASPKPVATGEAARLCKLSPSRFAQLFVRATGLSFARYSLRFRLEQAAHDLASTDILLDELADKWGFSDKSHLVNRFQEHYRVTPGEYRARGNKQSH